ncbi:MULTISPECIES: hypothetical protein [Streptomyces]|uniref:hypothetical protein n=1 Tax=Streptomyces TaxID=1883 RepID=UPI0012FEEE62|nr:hypothetical protein [Streptomyces durhamensis]
MTSQPRSRPLIAVVGSIEPDSRITPPIKAADGARAACRALGGELARAGCDLAVFSSKPHYAEPHVVEGYAAPGGEGRSGVVFAHVPRQRDLGFALPEGSPAELRTVRDSSTEWEVSFYRTLLSCDGVMLIGGGQSTRAAGVVAMSQRIPVLPVAAFGGGASLVWANLDKVRNDTLDEDISLLGGDWTETSAADLTACLLRQRDRRLAARRREEEGLHRRVVRERLGLGVAVLFVLASLVALVLAGDPGPADGRSLATLVSAPLLASMGGAIIRNSFEENARGLLAAVRGLGAGLVSVFLYVASQLLALPGLLDQLDVRRLLFFVIPLGFSSGFTFDLVYERLRNGGTPPSLDPPPGTSAGG